MGYKIIGYGASAKGNTLLNFSKIHLDYIIDDSKYKWDYYTPGMNIPVKSIKELIDEKCEKLVVIPLAWNFYDEIHAKIN